MVLSVLFSPRHVRHFSHLTLQSCRQVVPGWEKKKEKKREHQKGDRTLSLSLPPPVFLHLLLLFLRPTETGKQQAVKKERKEENRRPDTGFSPFLFVTATIPCTTVLPRKFPFAKLIKWKKGEKKAGGNRGRRSSVAGLLSENISTEIATCTRHKDLTVASDRLTLSGGCVPT